MARTLVVSWEISRHPEWDEQFLGGATAREIADFFQANIATVHSHLKKREKYKPEFFLLHQQALARRREEKNSDLWVRNLAVVDEFVVSAGRLPSLTEGDVDIELCRWLENQRKFMTRGTIPIDRLAELRGKDWFELLSETALDRKWKMQLDNVICFVDKNDRFPKYRNYLSQSERNLGVWLHNQHQLKNSSKLKKERLNLLNYHLPGWRSFG